MDFDEAAESAVEKRKFLLNRVVKEKLLPNTVSDTEVLSSDHFLC